MLRLTGVGAVNRTLAPSPRAQPTKRGRLQRPTVWLPGLHRPSSGAAAPHYSAAASSPPWRSARRHPLAAVLPGVAAAAPLSAPWRHGSAGRGACVAQAQAPRSRRGTGAFARRRGIAAPRWAPFGPATRGQRHAFGRTRRQRWPARWRACGTLGGQARRDGGTPQQGAWRPRQRRRRRSGKSRGHGARWKRCASAGEE